MSEKATMLPARLRQALKAKRMTIEELSEKSAISLSGLKNWLGERASPRIDNLQKVADVLDVTVDWLLGKGDGGEDGPLTIDTVVIDGGRRLMAFQAQSRLTKTVEINRLVEAYEEAIDRAGGPNSDAYQLMELTLMLYDAMTVAEEAVTRALRKSGGEAPPK
jgi:transcriptional regulator with XRE-family HTH domain